MRAFVNRLIAHARATSRVCIVPRSEDTVPGNLVLITSIANQLLEATASTATQASEQVLAELVEHFDLRYSFLRYSDHGIRASVLAAEWPRRSDVADPDPFEVVSFSTDHPALALCESGKDLVVVQRDPYDGGFRCPITKRRRSAGQMMVAAPLVSGTLTSGVLGFVKCGGRRWKPDAIHTLETVASLFAQFQARISAEQRLRHLAEHDDGTGLRNRRALLAHLSDRLASQQPGPVAGVGIHLDRLKAINDSGHAAGDWFIKSFATGSMLAPGVRAWSRGSAATSSSSFRLSRCRPPPRHHSPTEFARWCTIT